MRELGADADSMPSKVNTVSNVWLVSKLLSLNKPTLFLLFVLFFLEQ